MQLKHCLLIDNVEDRNSLLTVLQTTKTIMTLTISNPVLDWADFNNGIMIFGGKREMDGVQLVLGQTLGLTDMDENVTMCPNLAVTPVQRVVEAVTDTPVAQPVHIRIDNDSAPTSAQMDAMFQEALPAFNPDVVSPRDDTYDSRREIATNELQILVGRHMAGDTQWETHYNRRMIQLEPTESNSGTITREEQMVFSEERNPRRWNLAKCRYNGSRYYLSYLVPPTANLFDTLRVVGGVHDGEAPEVLEICTFNTEAYWRELRHLMHRQAEFLREMAC